MHHRQDIVTSQSGSVIPNAKVTVTAYPSGATSVWAVDDQTQPVIPSSQVTTDEWGNYQYYAPSGRYIETVSLNGVVQYVKSDVHLVAAPGSTATGGIITDGAANHNIALSEVGAYLRMTRATANTVTMTLAVLNTMAPGDEISGIQAGAGQTTLTAGAGVTFNATPGVKTRAQYSAWTIKKAATGVCDVFGDLSA